MKTDIVDLNGGMKGKDFPEWIKKVNCFLLQRIFCLWLNTKISSCFS